MKFQFLGTSSGTPSKTRNVSGLALRGEGARAWVLVDCGEGTQHQLLHTGWTLHDLAAVCITHLHGDHCYGLPGLLASAGLMKRSAPLAIVGPAALWGYLEGVMRTTELSLPYALEFVAVDDPARLALPSLAGLDVGATPLSHRVPSYAYTFTERTVEARLDADKLRAAGIQPGPAWGRIGRGEDAVLADGRTLPASAFLQAPRAPRKVIVAGDNDTPALLLEAMRGAQVLVHEATYTQAVLERVGPGPRHSSAHLVAQAAAAAGLPNLVLTHFSPRYQPGSGPLSMGEVEDEARAAYDGTLFLARDFDRYRLGRDGVLEHVARDAADRR